MYHQILLSIHQCAMYALDTGNENNFDIRLVNGDVASEGRVEVFYGGQWEPFVMIFLMLMMPV